jgi:DNA-binding transcriptional LysR family regulator
MNDFDWLSLDARLLQTLVAVVETGSVTAAALRLDQTQSAVSHQLSQLRRITGDALAVKSGRGIVPTQRAEVLAQEARGLLLALERFARSGDFQAQRWQGDITIAANDLQRDVLMPGLLDRLREHAPGVRLRVIASDVPSVSLLRDDHCLLAISPRPPDGTDILQKRLFEDRHVVFFDANERPAPESLEDYLAADHVSVLYEPRRALMLDQVLQEQGVQRRIVAWVPGFAGLAALVTGSPRLCTAPALLARHLLRGLAFCEPPLSCPRLPMYLIWHRKHHDDPAHQWLRTQISELAVVT